MAGFILTWKEEKWDHKFIRQMIKTLDEQEFVDQLWRVFACRQAKKDDNAFLIKQQA